MAIDRIDSSSDDARREREVDLGIGTYAGAEAQLRQERRNKESFTRRREAELLGSGALQALPEPERRTRGAQISYEPPYNSTPDTSEPVSPEELEMIKAISDAGHKDHDERLIASGEDPRRVAALRLIADRKSGRIPK